MNSNLHDLAYSVDPALWVRQVLGINPTEWQQSFYGHRAEQRFWR